MKYFIRKIILLSLPILILLLTVNYFGDPANLFDDDYENEIAEILHKEHYVTNISNYDERILQKNLISMMKMPPDLVIIGSSRTILIGNKFFPGRKIFNNSVSGASHQDLISIYQMYKEHNLIPKKIIIGIDPWLLIPRAAKFCA